MSQYATIEEAQDYFDERLHTDAWDLASNTDRNKALAQATRAIDMLNFVGTKTSDSQELEFPRGGDTTIPTSVKHACAEIALSLLDGIDPVIEAENVGMVSQGYANVRSTYNPTVTKVHMMHGIPNVIAWRLLVPFIRHTDVVRISRVN